MTTIDPVKIFYEEVLAKQEKAAAQARLYNIAKKNTSFGFVDQFTDFVMNNNEFHQQQYRSNKQRNNSNSYNMRQQQHKSNQNNIKEKPQISNCYQQHKEIGNNGSTIKSTINRSLSTSSNFARAQNWRGSNNYQYQQPTQSSEPYYRGVIQKRCNDESIIIREMPNAELDCRNSAAVATEEIIKKFRIPKGIALTPKFPDDLNVGSHCPAEVVTNVSTALMSPPLTTNEDGDNSSGLVEYVEEVYDNDGDLAEEEGEDMHVEEMEEINESCDFHEYQETEHEEQNQLEDNDLIEEVESSEHQDLLMSGEADDLIDAANGNTDVLLETSCQQQTASSAASSAVPQIIQAVQPNGVVTCFQLPANTIILQSPDGALLATTAPHPTKPGQQQIIAIQDLNSQLSDILNLSSTNTTVVSSSSIQPSTVVLSPNGPTVPLVTSLGDSSGPSNIAHQSTTPAIITSNESLLKAQQQQILA
ncbi:hypothetical protein FF38_12169 [Lucilia cuprina]|uniref:Uncharacterized protein n=1 Tax=Lucilia cuprina TaxID=7375 RepID=A0A0L0BSH8_LUCCU|nr:hypothetical protein FF38_12169 [Lucilia cuprina]